MDYKKDFQKYSKGILYSVTFLKDECKIILKNDAGCKGCVISEGVSIWSQPQTNVRNSFPQVFTF